MKQLKQVPAVILGQNMGIVTYCILVAGFTLAYKLTPQGTSLCVNRWDVGWYKNIIHNGYLFAKGEESSVAFFPLFPFFWKFSGLSDNLISVVNSTVFVCGMILLNRTFRFTASRQFLYCSSFSMFFCYVPYTEAFFFLFISMFIYGIREDKPGIRYTGLLLASLTRSVSFLFIPIVLFSEFITSGKKSLREALILVAILLMGVAIVIYIQYIQSGHMFVFLETQEAWHRVFSLPTAIVGPLFDFSIMCVDGCALLLSVVSVILVSLLALKAIRRRSFLAPGDKPLVYSLSYLSAMGLVALFFTGQTLEGYTNISSLNRFVFATPFFVVLLQQAERYISLTVPQLLYVFASTLVVSLAIFKHDTSPGNLVCLCGIALYVTGCAALFNRQTGKVASIVLGIASLAMQLCLFSCFGNGMWVG